MNVSPTTELLKLYKIGCDVESFRINWKRTDNYNETTHTSVDLTELFDNQGQAFDTILRVYATTSIDPDLWGR